MCLQVPARNQIFVSNLEFVGRTERGWEHIHRFVSNLEFVERTMVRGGKIFTGLSPSSTFLFPEEEETESSWASATPSLMFTLWLIVTIWILPFLYFLITSLSPFPEKINTSTNQIDKAESP